jgi:vancomycin resistance protein YoaR
VSAAFTQPRISDAAAKRARAVAERMIGDPATVTYGAKSWPLSKAEIASMVSVRSDVSSSSAEAGRLVPSIDVKRAEKIIVPKVGAALGSQPVDAKFVAEGAAVRLVPSKDGVGPDVADFSANLTAALQAEGGTRSVELRTKVTSPSITTAKAEAMGIRERISAFTTEYKGGLPARVNNVRVLAAALDGKLVAPGDTFSLNEAVGERTASKGYQEANAIVKGKLVPQMGGGICQVATTFFNTVFMSGLPVTERVPHSFYIAHYPMGRDCTVSWGGPDFKWKNTTPNWVLVSAGLAGDKVTVSLYGTSPGYTVAYTTTPFSNDVPFKTTKVSDPMLALGTQKVVEGGLNGGKAAVVRTVKQGSTVVRTDTFASSYTPVAQTVAVGTLKPASKPVPASVPPKKR